MNALRRRIEQILSKDGFYWICWYIVKGTCIDRFLSDKTYIRLQYRCATGEKLNLENPKSFNEKLQWLKLYDHNPEYTKMVDKVEAKKIVASIIGEEYIIPTIAVYDRIEDIEWDKLPNQFVMKCSHDSGGLVVCKDKEKLDIPAAIRKLRKSYKQNFYYFSREWPYKNVKPRVLVEKYMTDDGDGLTDYKIHNFNGVPKAILVCKDRYKETGMIKEFYNEKWEPLNISRGTQTNFSEHIERPATLDQMLELSKKLSQQLTFVRSDFYSIGDKVYFGELTFFPFGGMGPFSPEEWNNKFGEWIKLPNA